MAKSLTPEQIKRRQEAKARSSKRNGTHWNKSRRDAALELLFRKRPNSYTNKPAHPKLFKAIKAAGEKAEVRKQNRAKARERSNLRNGLFSSTGIGDRGGVYSGNQDRKDAATKLRSKRSIARGQGPILTYSQTRRREAAKGRQTPEVRKRAADQLRALRSKGYKFTSNKRQIATDGVGGKWTGTKMVGKNAKLTVSRKYGEVVVDKYRKVSYTAKTGAPGAKWDKVDAKRVTGFGHPVGVKARALKAPKAKVAAPAKAAAPKATSGGGPTYGSKLHGQIKKSRGSSWLDKLTTPNPSTTIGSNDGPRLGPARTVSKARRRVQARMAQNAKHGLRSFEGVGSPEKIHGFSAARQARANILKRERKASKQAADRAIGRIKATNRSNIKHGLMIGTQKGEWSRKQKADILRRDHRAKLANSKAKRMDTLKVTATVHPWATKTPKADSWGRRNAKVRSSDRYGLTSTKRGSEERKAQAAKLRAERALNRSMDTPKIGTSLGSSAKAQAKSPSPSFSRGTQGITGKPVIIPRTVKAMKALERSNSRWGVGQATVKGPGNTLRMARAAEIRARRSSRQAAGVPYSNAGVKTGRVKMGPIRISAADKQAAINKQRMAAQNAGMRAEAEAKAKAYRAEARKTNRLMAKMRSGEKAGLSGGMSMDAGSRKAKADAIRQRRNQVKMGAFVIPKAYDPATNRGSRGKLDAIIASNFRNHTIGADKGSESRKFAAQQLRAKRKTDRMVAKAKADAAAAGFTAVRPGSKVGHIPVGASPGMSRERVSQLRALGSQAIAAHRQQKELDKTRAQVRKANGTHKAVPKARRPDPGGKKGFARYQAKLNSSKRVYGAFPKGTTAKPFSPERKFAASQLKAARKMGLRGNAARSHVRTAAQRAASIRNLMKARMSRSKPGAFRPKRK